MKAVLRFKVTLVTGEVDRRRAHEVRVATMDEANTVVSLFTDKAKPEEWDSVTVYTGGLMVTWLRFMSGEWRRAA